MTTNSALDALREAIKHCEEGNPQEKGQIVINAAKVLLKIMEIEKKNHEVRISWCKPIDFENYGWNAAIDHIHNLFREGFE